MAVAVIHFLEMVHITQDDRDCAVFPLPAHAGNFTLQQIQDHAPVPQAGERVVRRLKTHFFTRFYKAVFKMENSFAGAQPRAQLFRVKRLGQVIVRPGLQTRDNVFLGLP